MIKISICPKNKAYFTKLKRFGKEIVEICKEIGIEPIVYGGLIYFAYTKDKNEAVHDIDFLIPEKYLDKIADKLKEKRIKYNWNKEKHDFKIHKYGTMIELDSLEGYKRDRRVKNEFDFGGLKVNAVSLESLTNTYRDACRESHGKHAQHVKRYEKLLKIKNP